MVIRHRILASITKPNAKKLAAAYVRIHNDAAKKYKEAFKKVGARMWRDDDCHPIKPAAVDGIANTMMRTFAMYWTFQRPLTVLDSYPEVKQDRKKMRQLNTEVDAIHKAATDEWLDLVYDTPGVPPRMAGDRDAPGRASDDFQKQVKSWR